MHSTLIALSVLLGCAWCTPFQATVTLPDTESIDSLTCTVTITNLGPRSIILYKRNTPLEGIKSDIFVVELEGRPVAYDGFFFKRAQVTMFSEGIFLKSNQSTSVDVDLSTGYSFANAGQYSISLNTEIFFSDDDKELKHVPLQSSPVTFRLYRENNILMSTGEKHRLERRNYKTEIKDDSKVTGSPLSVKFMGPHYQSDEDDTNTAWSNAYKAVVATIPDMSNKPSHYQTWFGVSPTSTPWSSTFSTLQKAMETQQFYIAYGGRECTDSTFAYTYYGGEVIYVCTGYIYAQQRDYDSKFGTLVHELTHAVVGTKDIQYGVDGCLKLAKTNPSQAVMNADNYEYFVETL